jgi:predicted  nucleic acid-binding Zn-ribbon protein
LSELAGLRQELESWQSASEDSQKQVVELRVSLEQSETKLMRLSATWKLSVDSWKAAADAADLRARKARRGGVVMAVLAALAGGVIGYFIGK